MPTTSSTTHKAPPSGEGSTKNTTPSSLKKGQSPETSSSPRGPLAHSGEGKVASTEEDPSASTGSYPSEQPGHRPYPPTYHHYDPVDHDTPGKHYQSAPIEQSHSYYTHHMYSGSASGGGTASVPYPPASGTYHAVSAPPPHGRTGPAPQGYMVQSYVVTGPPGSGPPPGYIYAGPPPPGYHTSPLPQEGAPSIRSSPSMSHSGAPPHYERTGSTGFMDHPSMYPPPGSSHSPPVHRTNSTGAGSTSSHTHHERAPAHMSHGYGLPVHHPHPSGRPPSHAGLMPGHHLPRPGTMEMDNRTAEEIQKERIRQAAEYELSLSRVKPIKTDYHWFAQKLEKEEGVPPEIENDAFLRNSYLNARLKHRWEIMDQDERMEFLKQEEGDRRRFTEEEEVASRHCATLTARGPPAGSAKSKDKRTSASTEESPPKKTKSDE